MTLRPEQRDRMIAFLDDLPWVDVDFEIETFEEALRLALEATQEDFQLWEAEGELRYGSDEFNVSRSDVEEMSDEFRLAYIARQLRTLARAYGVSAGFGTGPLVGDTTDYYAIGGIVRELNAITWTRCGERDGEDDDPR